MLPDQPLERRGADLELLGNLPDGHSCAVPLDHPGDVLWREPKGHEVLPGVPAGRGQLLRLLFGREGLNPLEPSRGPGEVIEEIASVRVPPQ